jgi:hypothetical protein
MNYLNLQPGIADEGGLDVRASGAKLHLLAP